MINNKLTIWEIDIRENNKNEFFIDRILDEMTSLKIYLSDKFDKRIILKWDNIISYRNTYESYFSYGAYHVENDSLLGNNFYIIENSDYIEDILNWAYPDVINETLKFNLKHYAVYTVDYCFDIISTSEPVVL